jgi:hypothetical protein
LVRGKRLFRYRIGRSRDFGQAIDLTTNATNATLATEFWDKWNEGGAGIVSVTAQTSIGITYGVFVTAVLQKRKIN